MVIAVPAAARLCARRAAWRSEISSKLGTRYSDAMGATFQDKDGSEKPVIMGSYGIGSGRLLASVAEEHNDDWGLIWPISVAPYHVHLVMLPHKKDRARLLKAANKLYEDLQATDWRCSSMTEKKAPA